jgi:hypothetical protein
MRKYTKEMIAWLKANTSYRVCETVKLFNEFFGTDYSQSSIKAALTNHKIKRAGFDGRFGKGHIPHNKGKKGACYRPSSAFKPGDIPWNYRPVGSERMAKDGYTRVKIAEPNIWRTKHRVLWEAAHGEIPKGCRIVFADGDRENFAIENLVAVPVKQAAIINRIGIPYSDAETLTSAVAVASVIVAVAERMRSR